MGHFGPARVQNESNHEVEPPAAARKIISLMVRLGRNVSERNVLLGRNVVWREMSQGETS